MPDHLRDHERGLLRAVGVITARVVSHTVLGEMTYVVDRRSAEDKYFGARHDPDWQRSRALAETVALDRLAAKITEKETTR